MHRNQLLTNAHSPDISRGFVSLANDDLFRGPSS